MNKPFAESCQQNREPIFKVIQPLLESYRTVLEIGSGTGQHAVYFAGKLPHLQWQTSDRAEYHQGIHLWLEDANHANIQAPLLLDVSKDSWPTDLFDAIFSANTLHIMSHFDVVNFFKHLSRCLQPDGLLIIYGPFNYEGHYTSASNAQFDQWLKSQDINRGIKDFEWIDRLAEMGGLKLVSDISMPANNKILCWKKG